MGVWVRRALASALLASWAVGLRGEAIATPLFVSPPHFLALGNRFQLVFFVNEPVVGALAARTPDGLIDVIVPEALVDPTLDGAVFDSDEWPGRRASVRVAKVTPGGGPGTGAAIQIDPGMPVEAVDAFAVDAPPRLIVELHGSRPTVTPRVTPRPTATPARPTAVPSATAGTSPAPPSASGVGSPAPAATPEPAPVPDAGSPSEAAVARAGSAPGRGVMPCHYRRFQGVAFCAPAAETVPYEADPGLAALARALREGERVPRGATTARAGPAALYLAADRALVAGAARRRLLAAVDAYRRALRRYPAFFDAPRARLNIAFAYDAMGLGIELAAAAAAAADDPGAALARALVGDAAVALGEFARARAIYRELAAAGDLGACLAARGRVRLALATAAAPPSRALAGLGARCPTAILEDAETERLRARVLLASGDAAGAVAILARLRTAFGPGGAAPVLEDLAAATAAAGDVAAARRLYEELARGGHGVAAATRATIGLARLAATSGELAMALRRLDTLPPAQAEAARRGLARQAVSTALGRGADAEAVATLHEHGVLPAELAVDDQIRLAASYRALGLRAEGERLLERARAAVGPRAPDHLWEALARAALAHGGAAEALAIAEQWQRVRDGQAPSAALAVRARALAQRGDVAAALALVRGPLAEVDPATARDLRIAIAELVRPHDPAQAVALLRTALATAGAAAVPAAQAAAAWRALGEAAEDIGDDATALEAFTQLSVRYGEQPSATGAAYRAARLAAGRGAGVDAYEQAAKSGDAITRRVALAARAYESIVAPLEALRFEEMEIEKGMGEEAR